MFSRARPRNFWKQRAWRRCCPGNCRPTLACHFNRCGGITPRQHAANHCFLWIPISQSYCERSARVGGLDRQSMHLFSDHLHQCAAKAGPQSGRRSKLKPAAATAVLADRRGVCVQAHLPPPHMAFDVFGVSPEKTPVIHSFRSVMRAGKCALHPRQKSRHTKDLCRRANNR